MSTEFKHVSELEKMMTKEQKEKAREDFEKYYLIPFGDKEEIFCGPERFRRNGCQCEECLDDGEKYLKKVDLDRWED